MSYKEQRNAIDREKTEYLLSEILPRFCRKYHDDRVLRLSAKTQYNYASKMRIFLEYLHDHSPYFNKKAVRDITLDDIALLTKDDFLEFIAWLLNQKACRNSTKTLRKNSKSTADNYLACLSSYMSYFFRNEMLPKNPLIGIDREKKQVKPIIHLRDDERMNYLDAVCTGSGLSNRQKSHWDKNKLRESCMMLVLIDTGIRVSELVGLDIDDVDLDHFKLSIHRKGNKLDNAYFSDTTADILAEYLAARQESPVQDKNERALFLVSVGKYKGTRLGVRSVEKIVKKYASAAGIADFNKITPHKLRSTYAMAMLHATGNPAIVQEQLGHENISTTSLYSRGTEKDKIENRNAIFPEKDVAKK